jgi:hypothetical protein
MATGRVRLTRRGWVAVVVAGIVVLGGVTTALVRAARPPDCVLQRDGHAVELDRAEAERAAATAASAVFRGSGSGLGPAALTCRHGGARTTEPDSLDARGLTGRAAALRLDLLDRFGRLSLGGYAPGGVHTGHMPGSAHYEGRAIDVFFRPANAANRARGWAMAQYLVANAERLAINTVIFDDQVWTARQADDGWRHYRVPDPQNAHNARERAILEHRDHVHVDVAD